MTARRPLVHSGGGLAGELPDTDALRIPNLGSAPTAGANTGGLVRNGADLFYDNGTVLIPIEQSRIGKINSGTDTIGVSTSSAGQIVMHNTDFAQGITANLSLNGGFTIIEAGYYNFKGNFLINDGGSATSMALGVGTSAGAGDYVWAYFPGVSPSNVTFDLVLQCAAGDFIEAWGVGSTRAVTFHNDRGAQLTAIKVG